MHLHMIECDVHWIEVSGAQKFRSEFLDVQPLIVPAHAATLEAVTSAA